MPLPLIISIPTWVATGGYGCYKIVKAISDNSYASSYADRANRIISEAFAKADESRKEANSSLESLGKVKLETVDKTIGSFLKTFGKIKNVNFSEVDINSEFKNLNLDSANIAELSKMTAVASDVLKGLVSGALLGLATAYGAYSAVGWLASAGTGIAISKLGGTAATNATLAWLGGGTLVAGGGGVAGGAVVLGGLVATPALLVLGAVMGANASANLDNARADYAKAQDYEEQMELLCSTCKKISEHADFMRKVITVLAKVCDKGIGKLQKTIEAYGTEWNRFPQKSKEDVAVLGSAIKLLKTVLDIKILTDAGEPSDESDPESIKLEYPDLAQIS